MIVSLTLPDNLSTVIELEAARRGQSVAKWIEERLHDTFGIRHVSSATRIPVVSETDPEQRR